MSQALVKWRRKEKKAAETSAEAAEKKPMSIDDTDDQVHEDESDEAEDTQGYMGAGRSNGASQAAAARPRTSESDKDNKPGPAAGRRKGHVGMGNNEFGGWSYKEADLMWGEMLGNEHGKALKRLSPSRSAHDIVCQVIRIDAPGRGGVNLGVIEGSSISGNQNASPGDMLQRRVEDDFHMVSGRGPGLYEIRFVWKTDNRIYGRGQISLPDPAEISALRLAQAQNAAQQRQMFGQAQPPQPAYQPPPGVAAQPQQQPVQPIYQPPPAATYPTYPQPQPGYGYAPYGQPQQQPAASPSQHNPEVSQLRAEVGELRGTLRETLDFLREGRRSPPPMPPPVQGLGAAPEPPPRRERNEDEDEEIADLRDEVAGLSHQMSQLLTAFRNNGPGGSTPAPAGVGAVPSTYAQRMQQQEPPTPPPIRSPDGQFIYINGVGWCAPAAPPVAAQPPPSVAPAQAQGLGAAPSVAGPGLGAAESITSTVDNIVAQVKAIKQAQKAFGSLGSVFGAQEQAEPEEEPDIEEEEEEEETEAPEKPEDSLAWQAIKIDNAPLFGRDVVYTPNKKTKKIDWEGLVVQNPQVVEKGFEMLGSLAEAGAELLKKVTANVARGQQTGVGAAPNVRQVQSLPQQEAQPEGEVVDAPAEGDEEGTV